MDEEKSREYFEAWWAVTGYDEVTKDIAWRAWEKSRSLTEIYLKG